HFDHQWGGYLPHRGRRSGGTKTVKADEERIQAEPQRIVKPNHPVGWLVRGTEGSYPRSQTTSDATWTRGHPRDTCMLQRTSSTGELTPCFMDDRSSLGGSSVPLYRPLRPNSRFRPQTYPARSELPPHRGHHPTTRRTALRSLQR